jgi:hypothetical protein
MAVCGGGALNNHLMHRLNAGHFTRGANGCAGPACDAVEACAFAWLAVKPSWGKQEPSKRHGRTRRRVLGPFTPITLPEAWPGQAKKLEPQPQVVVAFGFLITNCAP